MLLAERVARAEVEAKLARAEAANAQANLSSTEALISYFKLEIEKLRCQLYGSRPEKVRLLEQMDLHLEGAGGGSSDDDLAAEKAAARTQR